MSWLAGPVGWDGGGVEDGRNEEVVSVGELIVMCRVAGGNCGVDAMVKS